MSEIRDRVREKIVSKLKLAQRGYDPLEIADEILSLRIDGRYELTVVDRDAIAPISPYLNARRGVRQIRDEAYREAEHDMVNEGWVKEAK